MTKPSRSRGTFERSLPVMATAVVGLAGILAAFLAPTWSTKEIERREERREFRAAQRLVVDELAAVALSLKSATGADREVTLAILVRDPFPPPQSQLATPEWTTHKTTLAESLPPQMW